MKYPNKEDFLEALTTSIQWVSWQWVVFPATLFISESTKQTITVIIAISAEEIISTHIYGKLLSNQSEYQFKQFHKPALANALSGNTFFFVDNTIAANVKNNVLLWRCIGVAGADGLVHIATQVIFDKTSSAWNDRRVLPLQESLNGDEHQKRDDSKKSNLTFALTAGMCAIAYNLGGTVGEVFNAAMAIENPYFKQATQSVGIMTLTMFISLLITILDVDTAIDKAANFISTRVQNRF